MPLQALLQSPVAVHRNRESNVAVAAPVDVMTSLDPESLPAVLFKQPPELATGECLHLISDGYLDDPVTRATLNRVQVDLQTSLHRLVEVPEKLLEGLALRGAAGDRRDLGPIAAFFRLVDDDLQLHGTTLAHRRDQFDAAAACRRGTSAMRIRPIVLP